MVNLPILPKFGRNKSREVKEIPETEVTQTPSGNLEVSPRNEDDDKFDDDKELELSNILDNMDIDKDYNMWTSFRSSIDGINSDCLFEDDKIEDAWQSRYMDRDEIFSRRYKPTQEEKQELGELAAFLGVRSGGLLGAFGISSNDDQEVTPISAIFDDDSQPKSILLKRGPVLCQGEERELYFLTHGFVTAKVGGASTAADPRATPRTKKKQLFPKFLPRSYDRCHLWSSVEVVRAATPLQDLHDLSFDIVLNDDTNLSFQCATMMEKRAWLQALLRILGQTRLHHDDITDTSIEGWQYRLVPTSLFSAAVSGDTDILSKEVLHCTNINQLDSYRGWSPLHYATRFNHIGVMKVLLDRGKAYANVVDRDDRTPMYYATKDELERAQQVLTQFGGRPSKLAETEQRGELFGMVDQVEQERQEKKQEREKKEAEEKAARAQSTMNDAMAALQERGERIEELHVKSNALESGAADYADMAKQLKDKMKKKAWYNFG